MQQFLDVIVSRSRVVRPFNEPDAVFTAKIALSAVEFLPVGKSFFSSEKFDRKIVLDPLKFYCRHQ